MTHDEWPRIRELFDTVTELDPGRRSAYLDRVCADAPGIRREVESLLRSSGAAAAFLEEPALHGGATQSGPGAAPAGESPGAADNGDTPSGGSMFGTYQVIRHIGSGGMGDVFLAEDTRTAGDTVDDAAAVNRPPVAIKCVRRGMDSEQVLRRFREEQRTLGRLQHDNIAKLIDGGVAADGRPYLVMEYVPGVPLLPYCDAHRLTLLDRLRLFRRVCAAVEYAHQNMVVHRDIKPSNILVNDDGVPKLLDFGLAKLLHGDGDGDGHDPEDDSRCDSRDDPTAERRAEPGEATVTETALRALTPDYASPEQIAGRPITMASDVYSLGVVLYQLLTGRRPYSTRGRSAMEIERLVCEAETTPPSAVVGDDREGTRSTAVAQRRGVSTTDRLRRDLAGDLDTIVLTALRKEPARRYGFVHRLSDDIDRFLGGRPITARRDTLAYRARKYASRNRALVVAAAVVALSLVAGLIGVVWQGQVARAEAARASAEAATSQRVIAFLTGLFEATDPLRAGQPPTVRDILDAGAARIHTELADDPVVQSTLMNAMGQIYGNLGLLHPARDLFEAALAVRIELHGPDDIDVAELYNNLGVLHRQLNEFDLAATHLAEAVRIRRAAHGLSRSVAISIANLGNLRLTMGDREEARALFEEAYAMLGQLEDDPMLLTNVLFNLAIIKRGDGDLRGAEAIYREALDIRLAACVNDDAPVAPALNNLASNLSLQGRYRDSADYYRRSLDIRRRHYPPESPVVATGLNNLGKVQVLLGEIDEAEENLRAALAIWSEAFEAPHGSIATALLNLAGALRHRADHETAVAYLRDAIAMWTELYGRDHPKVLNGLALLGDAERERGHLDEAEARLAEATEMADRLYPPGHHFRVALLEYVGNVQRDRGNVREAARLYREAIGLADAALGVDHPVRARIAGRLGWLLHNDARSVEGLEHLEEAATVLTEALGADHPETIALISRRDTVRAICADR